MRPIVIAAQRAAYLRTTPSSLPIATIASPRPKSSLCPSRSKTTHPHDTAMSSSSSKRPADDTNDPSISPPPVKRRAQIQSNVTNSTVASFFTPTSQKPKISAKVDWSQHSPNDGPATLLLGRYHTSTKYGTEDASVKRTRVAAFDLDGTLITTASGKKFTDDPADWKWWNPTVRTKLRTLYDEGFRIIIFSNQNGLVLEHNPKAKGPKNSKRLPNWKQKLTAILTELDIPLSIYAATAKDGFRKPCTGMWDQMCRDYKLDNKSITIEESFFIGDAGGRVAQPVSGSAKAVAKDFSCSDRNFAHNVGLRFETPEEFFLDQPPRDFQRDFDPSSYPHKDLPSDIVFEKKFETELVVFSGPPGAGKSTFFWRYLQPLGYVRVNQDELKTRDKCVKAAKALLEQGKSVAVDNTNPDPDTRKIWVDLAKHLRDSGVSTATPRCVFFRTPLPVAEHNNAARSRNPSINPEARDLVPKLAFNTFSSRFKEPNAVKELFADVIPVDFEYRGSKEEFAIWSRYWS